MYLELDLDEPASQKSLIIVVICNLFTYIISQRCSKDQKENKKIVNIFEDPTPEEVTMM